MGKTREGYGSCRRGCKCPRHGGRDEPELTFRQRVKFLAEPPGSLDFGKSREEWLASQEAAPPAVPHVSSLPPEEPDAGEEWWDGDGPQPEAWSPDPERPDSPAFDRMAQEMRDRRALGEPDVPPGVPDASPMGRLLGADTQEGADKFARLKAYREAGYTGPLDQENNIPDPDDPANWEWMSAGAAMREPR